VTKASCPGCGKVVAVAGESSPIAGRLLRHHSASGGGMCPKGGKHRALRRELIHPCKRCAALSELPALPGGYEAVEHLPGDGQLEQYRPATPRPVTGGTLKLCATHRREHTAALKEGRADRLRERRFGVTREEWKQLKAAQGGGCACGVDHRSSRIRLVGDHDHEREKECVRLGRHEASDAKVSRACKRCMRGAAGGQCNQVIIGRFTSAQLRNLADYMDNPTAQRLGWWNDDDDDDDDDEQET
jgi:hypothetical protein